MYEWERVYCCLNPREGAMAAFTAVEFTASLGAAFPSAGWDGLWDSYGDSSSAYRDAFIAAWGLERTVIVVDEIPVPAIGSGYVFVWAEFGVWLVASGGACPSGCAAHPFL